MAWFNSSWINRKKITIDKDKVNADLDGFSIYFPFTDAEIKDARADGFDFVFTKGDGITEIPYERLFWDNATGELIVFFKGDILDASDVDFYIYYKNSGQDSDKADPTNVWDSNYKLVAHMQETSGDYIDSTINDNDASNIQANSRTATAKLGKNAIDFGSGNDHVDWNNILQVTTGNFTLSIWANPANADSNQVLVGKKQGHKSANQAGYQIIQTTSGAGKWSVTVSDGTDEMEIISGDVDTIYQLIVFTYDGATQTGKLYKNGVLLATVTNTSVGSITSSKKFIAGYDAGGFNDYNGISEEIRFSDIVRTPELIATEYNSQHDPSTFFSVGAEETETPTTGFAHSQGVVIA